MAWWVEHCFKTSGSGFKCVTSAKAEQLCACVEYCQFIYASYNIRHNEDMYISRFNLNVNQLLNESHSLLFWSPNTLFFTNVLYSDTPDTIYPKPN